MSLGRALRALPLLLVVALAACSAEAASPEPPSFDTVSTDGARDLPPSGPFVDGRPGARGGMTLEPISTSIEPATAYRFSLGHCGLFSPIDVNGSFWDPVEGRTASGAPLDLDGDPEMINATAGFFVVIGDEARFRTETGTVLELRRHPGEKEFPGCD